MSLFFSSNYIYTRNGKHSIFLKPILKFIARRHHSLKMPRKLAAVINRTSILQMARRWKYKLAKQISNLKFIDYSLYVNAKPNKITMAVKILKEKNF